MRDFTRTAGYAKQVVRYNTSIMKYFAQIVMQTFLADPAELGAGLVTLVVDQGDCEESIP